VADGSPAPRVPARRLGRGLSALLGDPVAGSAGGSDLRRLPVGAIRPNPRQPRRRLDEAALDALAESLRTTGLMQPVVVRALADIPDEYELIAGERRWRAAQRAGLVTLPALVRTADERERLEMALVENMVREDLSPVEVARACATLIEDFGQTHQQVAAGLGRSRPAITNLVRLLELPDDVQELISRGTLSEGHGRAILMVDGARARRALAQRAASEELSVRATERYARAATPAPTSKKERPRGPLADAAIDAFAGVFDVPVALRRVAKGGLVVELRFADDDALRAALDRISAKD
jgi:ParB family transcriptional regulator, chromosome partitioning protein